MLRLCKLSPAPILPVLTCNCVACGQCGCEEPRPGGPAAVGQKVTGVEQDEEHGHDARERRLGTLASPPQESEAYRSCEQDRREEE